MKSHIMNSFFQPLEFVNQSGVCCFVRHPAALVGVRRDVKQSGSQGKCEGLSGSGGSGAQFLSFKFDLAQLVLFLAPTEFALRNFNIW